MTTSNELKETLDYLKSCVRKLNSLAIVNASKKKTTKQKAYASIISIVEQRISAKASLASASISDGSAFVANLKIHESIYKPIIDFLEKELNGEDHND